jgi:hypothetical protein
MIILLLELSSPERVFLTLLGYGKIPIKRPPGLNIFQKGAIITTQIFPKSRNHCKYV